MQNSNGNCLVQHEVRYDKRGHSIGVGYRGIGKKILPITHFYRHTTNNNQVCKVSTGDIWEVKPINHPDYQFVTI